MKKPDWSKAPEEAKYLAQDHNGMWCWYKRPPTMLNWGWRANGPWSLALQDRRNENWRETLEARPK